MYKKIESHIQSRRVNPEQEKAATVGKIQNSCGRHEKLTIGGLGCSNLACDSHGRRAYDTLEDKVEAHKCLHTNARRFCQHEAILLTETNSQIQQSSSYGDRSICSAHRFKKSSFEACAADKVQLLYDYRMVPRIGCRHHPIVQRRRSNTLCYRG